MPSGLLDYPNVKYYLPSDDLVEYTQNIPWTGDNVQFAPSILVSGITAVATTSTMKHVISPYTSPLAAREFTCCLWTSGFFASDNEFRRIEIGYANSSDQFRDGLWLSKGNTSSDFQIQIESANTRVSHPWTPAPPNNTGWHFTVLDGRYETSGWRARVSLDGSGWIDLGVDSNTAVPTDDARVKVLLIRASTEVAVYYDEVVLWTENDLFTDQELSNLYELYNTHGTTMDQYTSTFGTLVTDNIDCFIQGGKQIAGNISLYIPGQKETKSIDLFNEGSIQISSNIDLYMSGSPTITSGSIDLYLKVITPINDNISLYTAGPSPISGNVDNFIQGNQILSDNIDQYIRGHGTTSSNINLYVSGIPSLSSSIDLYITGPIRVSGSFDDFIEGHLSASGNFSLFMRSGLDIDAFVAVVDNNPSNTVDLFVHGIPSGASPSFYINNTITLFIHNDGSNVEFQSIWSAFIRIDDAIPVSSSDTWQSFLRGGNTTNNDIDLYINSHASGEAPHGILTSGLFTTFIDGKSTQDGDEGLLSEGYLIKSFEVLGFTKVHLGVSGISNLYVSGDMAIIPPSATLDLFVFGIIDIASGSHDLYISGKELVSGSYDLFVFGIQGAESGNIPLYIQVTTLGSFNTEFDLYTHGF